MTLLQLDFAYHGPFGAEMTEALDGLARSIAEEPGFIWKVWTENEATQEAGGIYLFTDEGSARKYMEKHAARLKGLGVGQVNAKYFDVNVPLSKITHGAV